MSKSTKLNSRSPGLLKRYRKSFLHIYNSGCHNHIYRCDLDNLFIRLLLCQMDKIKYLSAPTDRQIRRAFIVLKQIYFGLIMTMAIS